MQDHEKNLAPEPLDEILLFPLEMGIVSIDWLIWHTLEFNVCIGYLFDLQVETQGRTFFMEN